MTTRLRLALSAGAALSVAASLLVATGSAASAATLPWAADPNSIGSLSFYDSTGAPVTGGTVTDAPFASYVKGSAAGRAGDTKATLFGYLPKSGIAAGGWTGQQLSASTDYPNAAAPGSLGTSTLPVVSLTPANLTIANLVAALPNTAVDDYQGLYELRLKTSGASQPPGATYQSVAIQVSGTSWNVVSLGSDLPNAPAGLSVTGAAVSASLTWTPPASPTPITSYTVVATPSTGTPITTVVPVAGLTFPVTVSGLAPSTTYAFSVKATNAAGTGAAATATLKGSKTTETVTPTGVLYGKTVTVTGKVTDADTSAGVAGQSIYLSVKVKGSTTYSSRGVKATTAANGTYSFTYTPGASAYYLVSSRGTGRLGADSTTATYVAVTATVTIKVSKSSVKAGTKVTFSGHVHPSSGAKVSLQRKEGSTWVTKLSQNAKSTGAYSFAWTPASKKDYSWRVVVSGPTFTHGTSATRVLKVT